MLISKQNRIMQAIAIATVSSFCPKLFAVVLSKTGNANQNITLTAAVLTDQINSANATGGPGTTTTNGGSANATAISSSLTIPVQATAIATGGSGGLGGAAISSAEVDGLSGTASSIALGGVGISGFTGGQGTAHSTLIFNVANGSGVVSATAGQNPASNYTGNGTFNGTRGNDASTNASALTTDPNSTSITIVDTAIGGNGTFGTGIGFASGSGGAPTVGFVPISTPSGDVNLTINAIGGDAGPTYNGASLGGGGRVILQNDFSIQTTGNITFAQNATGGKGFLNTNFDNNSSQFPAAGVGVSQVTLTDDNAASLNGTVSGIGQSPDNRGSTGDAEIHLTGNNAVTSYAIASGATSNANATAVSSHGPARATATVSFSNTTGDTLGYVSATTSSGVFLSAKAYASLRPAVGITESAQVLVGASNLTIPNQLFNTGYSVNFTPLTSNTSGPINNALADFAFIGGGAANFDGTLDPSSLAPRDLVLSFNQLNLPASFGLLSVSLSIKGTVTYSLSQTFTTTAVATQFFSQPIDLGSLAALGTSPIAVSLDIGFNPDSSGQTMNADFALSNTDPSLVPEPATLSLLAAAFPLLLRRRRS